MGDVDVLERIGWSWRTGGPAFDLVAAKLRRPLLRPGTVCRSAVIERLVRDGGPVVSVVAPAGFGKTTLLAQWAERDRRAFAWVSLDGTDNDPKFLLSYVAEALDAVEPIGEPVFEALASPVSSVPGSVVPRLASAFASLTTPVVLVLDDVHLLHNRECRAALSVLAGHVPEGSRLVLAGRAGPPLRMARLRAEGTITEVGPADLSLTLAEASALLREAGLTLGAAEMADLHRRTEGWPAGLYLAALAIREGGPAESPGAGFDGADQFITEYVDSEFLAQVSRRDREFLTRAAVLERLCGPLCEAVLELPGSGATLAGLARSNLLLVPLDRRGRWYRYHHLFRDVLLAELERAEPGLIPVLRRRAAGWCLANGLEEEALEYFIAAGDVEQSARLVSEFSLLAYRQGRVTTVQRWLQWLDRRDEISGHPVVAVLASLLSAVAGRPAEAERWADAVDRWRDGPAAGPGDPAAEAWAALLRAVLCRHGVEQMRADADEAARRFAAGGIVDPMPALCQGVARMLAGDLGAADSSFAEAAGAARESGAAEVLTRVHLVRADPAGARTLLQEIDDLLQRRPGLGTLAGEAAGLRARLAAERGSAAPGVSSLTAAELRVLPLLATHLSFREIAAELFVSRHTVRSQAMSVYRKLGASSRSQAVGRARGLGLLEG
jgi:LuxR family transcriptional regulator, maltose regulon positive regulatory protein